MSIPLVKLEQKVLSNPTYSSQQVAPTTAKSPSTVFILHMTHGEDNRFSLDFLKALHEALDQVESAIASQKLSHVALITSGRGKIYSNGLDLKSARSMGPAYFHLWNEFMARFLIFPVPTIAAINGHAFAGGCMFALAHDYRLMRADRGFMCMNEIDIGLSLARSMAGILNYKVPTFQVRRLMVLEGHRFTPSECLQYGLVDATHSDEEAVMTAALTLANRVSRFARVGKTFGAIKRELAAGYYDLFVDKTISSPGFEKYSGLGSPPSKL